MNRPFPQRFFNPPNELSLGTLNGAPGELVTRLIALAERGSRTLLPSRLGSVTRWYGMAPNSREERMLREEFRSWLGPPLTNAVVTVGNPRDDMDRAALANFDGWRILSADVNDSWQNAARDSVTVLLDVWSLAPERSVDAPRPVGRVLRQFYEALLGTSREDAEAALTELRARALMNATNLRFLRLHMLSELASPQALRDDPQMQGLTLLARPPAVTERLAAAADALVIHPAVDANLAFEAIGRDLERIWPGLVTERHQVTTASTARCFALVEIAMPSPRGPLLSDVANLFPDDPLLRGVAARWGTPPQPAAVVTALAHYHRGEYDLALTAAERDTAGRQTVGVALAAAVNLTTGEAASRALALFANLDARDQDHLEQNAVEAVVLEKLRAVTSGSRTPTGWLDWLQGDWADRPDLLEDWAHGWASPCSDGNEPAGELAVELLGALNDARRGRVRNGLPVFVNALLDVDLTASGVSLAVTLFDILLSSEPGRIERQASLAMLDEILRVGISTKEHDEILNAIDEQLQLLGPRDASWLVQVVDLLALHSSPQVDRREATLALACSTALAWRDRLDVLDAKLLSYLFPEAGFDATPSPAERDAPTERRPTTVGIYSLLESATRQATVWIRAKWPEVEIRTSSDHVNSDALTAMARGVDVFLVQTSHAKHAATQAIEAAIGDRSRLVLVNGRGASSLVRALLQWASE
jgi:hypothetical protein